MENNRYRMARTACICQRPKTNVICTLCGHVMFGRIHIDCAQHPMVIFLCDINNCSECLARRNYLKEFDSGKATKESNKENEFQEIYDLLDS